MLGFICPAGAAEAEEYEFIVIKKARQRVRVAVPGFREVADYPPEADVLERTTRKMRDTVELVGLFTLIQDEAYPRPVVESEGENFGAWRLINAGLLIRGEAALLEEDRYQLELRCFDVRQREMVLGKRYTGKGDLMNRMVLRFVDELIGWLTARKGTLDARIAYVSDISGRNEIHVMDTDGMHDYAMTGNRTLNLSPCFSPNGRYLVYTGYRARNPDLYIADIKENKVWKFMSGEGLNISPEFSPDGSMIAFASQRGGFNLDIYVLNARTRKTTRVTYASSEELSPTWSPDSKMLAFVSNRTGTPQIYLLDVSRGAESRKNRAARLTYEGDYNASPSWSPDGRWIAYTGRVGGQFDLFLIDMGGSEKPIKRLTATPANEETPAWSPDSLFLTYSSNKHGTYDIYLMSVYGGKPKRITRTSAKERMPTWSKRVEPEKGGQIK